MSHSYSSIPTSPLNLVPEPVPYLAMERLYGEGSEYNVVNPYSNMTQYKIKKNNASKSLLPAHWVIYSRYSYNIPVLKSAETGIWFFKAFRPDRENEPRKIELGEFYKSAKVQLEDIGILFFSKCNVNYIGKGFKNRAPEWSLKNKFA